MDKDGFLIVTDQKKRKADQRKQRQQTKGNQTEVAPTKQAPNSSNNNKSNNKSTAPSNNNNSNKSSSNNNNSNTGAQKEEAPKTSGSGPSNPKSEKTSEAPRQPRPPQQTDQTTEGAQDQKKVRKNPNVTRKDLEFEGRVLEVVSGDLLVIESLKSGRRGRFFLANVKCPTAGNRNREAKEWGYEAQELTRKLTVGKYVTVLLEFERKIQPKEEEKDAFGDTDKTSRRKGSNDVAPTGEQIMNFCSITVNEKNLTQELLERGLAELVEPFTEEETSKYFELYKKSNKPINATKKYTFPQFIDLTINDTKTAMRSREIFSTLQESNKRYHGVIEAVINGSRFKVRITEQNTLVWFVLDGVRCLPNDENYNNFPKWSSKALEFSRDNMYQRDIDFTLASVDKKGVLHGTVYYSKVDYAEELLKEGFAVTFGRNVSSHYSSLETEAKNKRIGLWSDKDLNIEGFRGESSSNDSKRTVEAISGTKQVVITELLGADEFFLQDGNSITLSNLNRDLAALKLPSSERLVTPIKKNTPCLAVFSADGLFYRAVVTNDKPNKNGKYRVYYTDFGNSEDVLDVDLYKMPSKFAGIAPQGEKAQLAYVRAPRPKTPASLELKDELNYYLFETQQNIIASFEYKDRGTTHVVLNFEGQGADKSVNVELIRGGFAQIDEGVDLPEKLEKVFYDAQDEAIEKKLGVWKEDDDDN